MSDAKSKSAAESDPVPQPAAPAVAHTQRVIIHRPYGETDSHAFIGYNDFSRQIKYDEPVELPVALVQHLRECRRVEFHSDAQGKPVASYTNTYSVVDAPD